MAGKLGRLLEGFATDPEFVLVSLGVPSLGAGVCLWWALGLGLGWAAGAVALLFVGQLACLGHPVLRWIPTCVGASVSASALGLILGLVLEHWLGKGGWWTGLAAGGAIGAWVGFDHYRGLSRRTREEGAPPSA